MSNRVEELEKQVADLRAAVNGLTEELVETKERVKQLEDSAEVQVAHAQDLTDASPGADGDVGTEVVAADEEAKSPEPDDGDDEGESEQNDSDIIVA